VKSLSATETARRFSDVLDAVEDGERFLIVRRGRVVARLEPAVAGVGRAVKDLLRNAPRDTAWLDDVRRTRALTQTEDRRWNG
jgi:prevent-host-death family protein